MKLIDSSTAYVINDREYFYNLNRPSHYPTSILANVPKLMPHIPIADPKVTKDSISTSIFVNDQKCKITVGQIINIQNYITITKHSNLSPSFYSTSSGGRMNKQVRHIIEVTNKDIRQMHFIEDQ